MRITVLAAFSAALLPNAVSSAADISWDAGAGTTAWDDALNWDGDVVPTDVDNVTIGDLPAAADATVVLNQDQSAARLVLMSGVDVDTSGAALQVGGNAVLQSGSRLAASGSGTLVNPSLEAFNVLVRGASQFELDDALATIATPGAGAANFGEVDIEAGSVFATTGAGRLVFDDDLGGGDAIQFNNNGLLRVGPPLGVAVGPNPTLLIQSTDAGARVDLDGDAGTGTIELGTAAVLNITTATEVFSSNAALADGAQWLFANDAEFGSTATLDFDGAAGSDSGVTNRLSSVGAITAQSGATFNINSGTTEIGGAFATVAGAPINVAADAAVAFAAPVVGDGSIRTEIGGALNLGAGSAFEVEGDVLVANGQFDWDGAGEDAETLVQPGGRLIIDVDTIESGAGDATFHGDVTVVGGATAEEAASLRTGVTEGWVLAGRMLLNGQSVENGFTASYLSLTGNTLTVAPSGTVTLDGGSIGSQSDGQIINEGVVEGYGQIGSIGYLNNGLIRAIAGPNNEPLTTSLARNFDLDGNDQVNPGAVEAIDGDIAVQGRLSDNFGGVATVGSGRTLDLQIGWILGANATLNLNGGAEPATVETSGINPGQTNEQNGVSVLRGTVNVVNTGRILGDSEVRASATINLTDDLGVLQFGGATSVEAGAAFSPDGAVVNLADGVMTTEDGVDFGTVALVNEGQLVLDGDLSGASFTQGAGGEVLIDIGGVLDSEYDQLDFGSFESLAGDLAVSFTGGFVAAEGDSFTLTTPTENETFETVLLPEIPAGLDWLIDYTELGLVVSVQADTPDPLTGDYNGDGVVDAADYTVWRDTEDSVVDLRADGDADGVIDADDYNLWAANHGATAPQSAIPEPTAALLATLAASAACRRR